jgi:hypothetical protein
VSPYYGLQRPRPAAVQEIIVAFAGMFIIKGTKYFYKMKFLKRHSYETEVKLMIKCLDVDRLSVSQQYLFQRFGVIGV